VCVCVCVCVCLTSHVSKRLSKYMYVPTRTHTGIQALTALLKINSAKIARLSVAVTATATSRGGIYPCVYVCVCVCVRNARDRVCRGAYFDARVCSSLDSCPYLTSRRDCNREDRCLSRVPLHSFPFFRLHTSIIRASISDQILMRSCAKSPAIFPRTLARISP